MPSWSEEEHAFARSLQRNLGVEERGMPSEVEKIGKPAAVFTGGASSDHGDVTLVAPTATVRFPGTVPGASGHHLSTVACGQGPMAWKGLNAGARAMAATAIDVMTQPDAQRAIREEFEAYVQEHPYETFLPEDATPPLDLYDEDMAQYRPLMEQFYLED
jgi:aminobenzoyl-glutamate utilization protein B